MGASEALGMACHGTGKQQQSSLGAGLGCLGRGEPGTGTRHSPLGFDPASRRRAPARAPAGAPAGVPAPQPRLDKKVANMHMHPLITGQNPKGGCAGWRARAHLAGVEGVRGGQLREGVIVGAGGAALEVLALGAPCSSPSRRESICWLRTQIFLEAWKFQASRKMTIGLGAMVCLQRECVCVRTRAGGRVGWVVVCVGGGGGG